MANEEEKVSWPYRDDSPYIGIKIQTDSGEEYPLANHEKLVLIDTAYDGEILLPRSIYHELRLYNWEKPEPLEYLLGDGSKMNLTSASGLVLIPKHSKSPIRVEIHTANEAGQDTDGILLGAKFIKRFKLLLNGPVSELTILQN